MIVSVPYVLFLKLYLIYSAKFNALLFGYYQHLNNLVHRLLELKISEGDSFSNDDLIICYGWSSYAKTAYLIWATMMQT